MQAMNSECPTELSTVVVSRRWERMKAGMYDTRRLSKEVIGEENEIVKNEYNARHKDGVPL